MTLSPVAPAHNRLRRLIWASAGTHFAMICRARLGRLVYNATVSILGAGSGEPSRSQYVDESTLTYLLWLAVSIGFLHTVMGPDHYIPFIAMARAGQWSVPKTLAVTVACGVGHVLGSVVLGMIGVAVGLAVNGLEQFEATRGAIAGWLLLGFGLAYTAWGIRRAVRHRPHTHWHHDMHGVIRQHTHQHDGEHTHEFAGRDRHSVMTTWVLFTIFVFGPCEPLIPILMYPAAERSWWAMCLIALVFAAATIGTMTTIVMAACLGLNRFPMPNLERYSHAAAGLALTACGLAIKLGL